MDRAQILEDLKAWLQVWADHKGNIGAAVVLRKINELEEEYE